MKIDELIRSKRKTVALMVKPDGRLVVRAPLRTPLHVIEGFVKEKEGWIREKQAEVLRLQQACPVRQYAEGEEFLFLGQVLRLELADARIPVSRDMSSLKFSRRVVPQAAEYLEAWYRKQAGEVIRERVAYWSQLTGIKHKSVKITGAMRRWGSCSSKNSLNFAWRLVMAPLEVIDYVVVHELVHVLEKNHSNRFWSRVEAIFPNHRQARLWLKDNHRRMTC